MDEINIKTISRGGKFLLENINIPLSPKQCVHLTGKNGVGKSSLLRAMAGLLPADGYTALNNAVYLSTDPDFDDNESIYHYHKIFGGNYQKILPADTLFNQLSSGMQQRQRILRLTPKARIWILDEPWQYLDISGISILDNMIIQHQNNGGMVIFTDHQNRDYPFNCIKIDLQNFTPKQQVDKWPF
jgi:heme exporter protein A